MADPIMLERLEDARSQPQHSSFDPVTYEIEEETPPEQPPTARRQRIDQELLRAIVNGDLMLFKSILGIEGESIDMESIRESNGNYSGLRGVAYGENTAFHVVAGVMEKSRQIPIFTINFLFFLVLAALYYIGLILIFLLLCYFIIKIVKKIVTVHFPWIPQKIYEKAKRTRWLKWVLFFYKRRMYMEIAEIIYRQDKNRTLLNARNYAEETPLHCAANAGNLHMVSLLVKFAREEGPQKLQQLLWARNQVGETALHEAARSGYSGIVKELLDADGILVSLEDDNGISPLYCAVTGGCLDVIHMLIAPNRLTSYTGPDGQTALHAAVMTRKEKILQKILDHKPSLAAETDKVGNTPLHFAALIGNTYAVKRLLLEDKGPVYTCNLTGSFPVHHAAEAGEVEVIKELLSMCPDVGELLDQEKRNFIHVAVQKKRKRVITLVGQVGINAKGINAKDKDGNTPLHLAVMSSDSEIFALLSKNKRVNPNIRNEEGLTPLDISASLQDHQLTYSLIPQYIIYRALLYRGAFQNPCQRDLSKKVDNLVKARADCSNRTEGKEMCNDVGGDIEKELTKYENISKSLITGAVLIASATFVAIFTVSKDYRDDETLRPTYLNTRYVFMAFVVADVVACICAIVSTIWLLYAALSNFHPKYQNIMRVILEWNPSLAVITDKAGNTPLHYAASIGNIYAVRKLLLKDTGSVYKANLSGSFPVHLAAEAGNFAVIKELLSMCPDVCELRDKQNRNFLHVAVQKRWIQIISFVCHCQEGINANMINAKDNDGNTPLHLAVISSQSEIFVVLYKNKRVNPNIRNKAGLTPLDISASLQDHQFAYSLNPQSIIHNALLKGGVFRNPCQPDPSKIVDNLLKKDDGASVDCPNRREGQEMWNGVGVDIEKESTKYENMSKSLITGAVLIASTTFVAIFTVSGIYKGDNTSHTWISRRNVFKAFVMADVLAFICAIVSTIWLLYSALSNFHLEYRKFYFQRCTPLLYGAINLFILTFGLGGYITMAPLSEWLALLILVVCGITIISNIIWSPKFVPLIHLAPYVLTE